MAYTNSPQEQTHKTVPIVFSQTAQYRYGDVTSQRDPSILNMYFDFKDGQGSEEPVRLKKRPGLATTDLSLSKTGSSSPVRGEFYEEASNSLYWAVANKVYVVRPSVSPTPRLVATIATSSGQVGFCQYMKSDNTRFVCISDGTELWLDNVGTESAAKVTDVDLPSPHVPYPVYINGYLFLAKANTGDIYNSNVDDPTAWTPGDFISAEMSGDHIRALARIKNYLVVFGFDSIEYFYDAGIATGSPLQRNDAAYQSVGYVTGLKAVGDSVIFAGSRKNQNVGIYVLSDFHLKKISNEMVERTLHTVGTTVDGKSNLKLNVNGHSISIDGHSFYLLPTLTTTWVYDISYNKWYEWRSSFNLGLAIEASWQTFNGACYVALNNGSNIVMFAPNTYQDDSANFTCQYITENLDFGTKNIKFGHRLYIDASQESTSGSSLLTITYSTTDWKQAVPATRTVNLFSTAPFISQLGPFKRISFKVSYADNYPLWLNGMMFDINVGQV